MGQSKSRKSLRDLSRIFFFFWDFLIFDNLYTQRGAKLTTPRSAVASSIDWASRVALPLKWSLLENELFSFYLDCIFKIHMRVTFYKDVFVHVFLFKIHKKYPFCFQRILIEGKMALETILGWNSSSPSKAPFGETASLKRLEAAQPTSAVPSRMPYTQSLPKTFVASVSGPFPVWNHSSFACFPMRIQGTCFSLGIYLAYYYFSTKNHQMPTTIMVTALSTGNTSMIRQDSWHHKLRSWWDAGLLADGITIVIYFLTYYKCRTRNVHLSLVALCVSASYLLLPPAIICFYSQNLLEPRAFSPWDYCFYFSYYVCLCLLMFEWSSKNISALLLKLLCKVPKA